MTLEFELPGGGQVLFTTRADGNLSTGAGACHEHGLRRRGELCQRLGLQWLCSSRQRHGTHMNVVKRIAGAAGQALPIDADGHATALADVGAMVLAADCLPVALGGSQAVAVIHAGWRGLAAGVIAEGVRALRGLSDDGRILAVVGPGAGACCYEVGADVHAAFAGVERTASGAGRPASHIDLRAIAHEQLAAAGVAEVRDVDACTICDERFFSHRREGAGAGRQAGVAWLS
jgi:YfiH family protein